MAEWVFLVTVQSYLTPGSVKFFQSYLLKTLQPPKANFYRKVVL